MNKTLCISFSLGFVGLFDLDLPEVLIFNKLCVISTHIFDNLW